VLRREVDRRDLDRELGFDVLDEQQQVQRIDDAPQVVRRRDLIDAAAAARMMIGEKRANGFLDRLTRGWLTA